MSKISACLVICDDEKYIEKCIKSILYLDEIIIVIDQKSKDGTERIIKKLKKKNPHIKIFKRKWQGFPKQRNFSMSKATGDWILIIDGDEILETDYNLHRYVKEIGEKENIDAFQLYIHNEKKGVTRICRNFRLWKNNVGIEYSCGMHENIDESLSKIKETRPLRTMGLPKVKLLHYGYDLSDEDWAIKCERNLQNHLQQLKEEPNNPMVKYHLGLLYQNKEDYNTALYWIFLALNTDELCDDYKAWLYIKLAEFYYKMGDVYAALRYLDASLKVIPEQVQSRFMLFAILKEAGEDKKADGVANEMRDILGNNKSQLQNDAVFPVEKLNEMLDACD